MNGTDDCYMQVTLLYKPNGHTEHSAAMTRSQQMVVVSAIFGVTVALCAMYATGALVPVAMVGGVIVGLGWAFYVNDDE